jgi:hypothetical protein
MNFCQFSKTHKNVGFCPVTDTVVKFLKVQIRWKSATILSTKKTHCDNTRGRLMTNNPEKISFGFTGGFSRAGSKESKELNRQ